MLNEKIKVQRKINFMTPFMKSSKMKNHIVWEYIHGW